MRVLLVSTYELGRQPFGLASPAAWLSERGHDVRCADLSVEPLRPDVVHDRELIAFYLPMHTATRLAVQLIPKVRQMNPTAHLCCYGLYAPLNEAYLRTIGVGTILGGEFEAVLPAVADGAGRTSLVSLDRLQFLTPVRTGLPPLEEYAKLRMNGTRKRVGYTEASRGCK